MTRALLTNNASTTLSAAITTTSATTFTVTSATGFPTPAAGQYFYCTLLDTAAVPEIVKVTNVTGTTFTCVRAQDGTAARTFVIGGSVKVNLTAAVMAEFADINTGAINTLTQTLGLTVAAGTGQSLVGPITVPSGQNITVASGARLVIL